MTVLLEYISYCRHGDYLLRLQNDCGHYSRMAAIRGSCLLQHKMIAMATIQKSCSLRYK